MSLVLSGGYEETVGKECRDVRQAQIVYHPADEEHAVAFGSVATNILRIELTASAEAYLDEFPRLQLRQPAVLKGGAVGALAVRISDAYRSKNSASGLALEAQVYEALSLIASPGQSTTGSKSIAAREYLDAYFTAPVGLHEVARSVGAHPGALARSFKANHGCTVGEYVRRLRLEHAAGLLVKSDLSLVAIAAESGFADQAHMTRTFSKIYRLTPSRYRAAYRAA